jgi:hypothetical protein
MSTVIEQRKPKIDRNGNWRISQEMIDEAKALDRAKGVPGMTEGRMEDVLAAAKGKPDTGWEKVEIEDLEREFGSSKKPENY